jgi:peptidoglycan hydrolase-like protein with peptidoglycan-binding domain
MIGIDIFSGNDTTPDLAASKAVGHLSFVIARAAEGVVLDSKYKSYVQQCANHGLPCSPYQLLRFGSEANGHSPEDQVKAALAFTGPLNQRFLPFAIDVEFPNGRHATGLTAPEALDCVRRAWKTVKEITGVPPLIYTSRVVWSDPDGLDNLPAPDLVESGMWPKYWPWPVGTSAIYDPVIVDHLPNPPVPTPFGTQWLAEQFMGDAPNYPGWKTKLDMNRMRYVRQGATGDTVKWIQRRVGITADGIFGPATVAAIKTFQLAHGLAADGIVGYDTTSVLAWHNPM